MINLPNALIVAGNGRDVGKTTLTCKLIAQYADLFKVEAIKITPHFHESGCKKLVETADYSISLEENNKSGKDTSRMLAAGANKVYYIQTVEAFIPDVLKHLLPLLPTNQPIVVESAAFRNYVKPGLFLLMTKEGYSPKNQKFIDLADRVISDFDYKLFDFVFSNNKWSYTNKYQK